jgi:hypothetical protein
MVETGGGHICEFSARSTLILLGRKTNATRQYRLPRCNLDLNAKPIFCLGRTVTAWGPRGEKLDFEPMAHVGRLTSSEYIIV